MKKYIKFQNIKKEFENFIVSYKNRIYSIKKQELIIGVATILIFLGVFYNFLIVPVPSTISPFTSTVGSTYTIQSVENVSLTIDELLIDVSHLGDTKITMHLIVENKENKTIDTLSIIVPWIKDANPHLVHNIYAKDSEYETVYVRYLLTSEKVRVPMPVAYRERNLSYDKIGFVTFEDDPFKYQYNFGTEIKLYPKEGIKPNERKHIFISFDLEGSVYSSSGGTLDTLIDISRPSPINFYPLKSRYLLKSSLIFPFAKDIEINEVFVNLPSGYSSIPYRVPNFYIENVNLTLKPENSYGFIGLLPPKSFKNDMCEYMRVPYRGYAYEGCLLEQTRFPSTEEIRNISNMWSLSYRNVDRNELYLMKFSYDLGFHPVFKDSPGMLTVLVDYKLNFWMLTIPIVLVIIILLISFSFSNTPPERSKKIAFLIPFIIALFTVWAISLDNSPPVHPNILDLIFLATFYISIISLLIESNERKTIFNLLFPIAISFLFLMLSDNLQGLLSLMTVDAPIKVALIYPIIAFSIFNPLLALLPVLGNAIIFKTQKLNLEIYLTWILRFLLLAILFPVFYDKIQKIIKLKNKNLHRFISIFAAFSIIWLAFIPFAFVFNPPCDYLEYLFSNIIFIPLTISVLLFIQLKISDRL